MISRFFAGVDVGIWSQMSAVIFLATFVAIFVWVYLPKRRPYYDHGSALPLKDDE